MSARIRQPPHLLHGPAWTMEQATAVSDILRAAMRLQAAQWAHIAYLAAQRAHTKALVAAARADEAMRDAVEDAITELRAAAGWRQATVYIPRDPTA